MSRNARAWGWMMLAAAAAASCETAEPVGVERGAEVADVGDAGARMRSTSLVFRRVFTSGPGGDAPTPSEVDGWTFSFPAVKTLAVGPGDDLWIAGRFFSPMQVGETALASAGGGDVFVIRLDRMGNPRWARRVGGPEDDACGGVAVDAEGNAIVVFQHPVGDERRPGPIMLAKLGADGDVLWQRPATLPIEEGSHPYLRAAATDHAGGVVLVATSIDDQFVARIDGSGDPIWKARLPLADAMPVDLAVDGAGNALVGSGSTVGPAIRVEKVTPTGTLQIRQRFRGYGDAINFHDIGADPRGSILLSGCGGVSLGAVPTPPEHRNDVWIAKLDDAGNLLWQKFGMAGRMTGDGDGNVLCANLHAVTKLDASGAPVWEYTPRLDGNGAVRAVAADSTGRAIYAGSFQGRIDFGDGPIESGERAALFVAALAP